MTDALTTALLYLDGVTVSFDGFKALNNLSLAIEPGEMRAIIGPNGAGKTTMMDVVTGKTRPDTGDVVFDGNHRPHPPRRGRDRRARHRPQVPEADRVRQPHRLRQPRACAQAGPPRPRRAVVARERRRERRRIDELLDIIRLAAVRDRLAGSLSHGQKQWLEIGMLLAQEPKLLLVDEPVAGMTDAETQQTAELLKEINRDRTVVVVEHDMAFVRELGVKVTCLHEGSVLAEGTIDQVSAERARRRSVSGAVRPMLDVNAIDLHYGAAQALRAVSLKAEPGKVTCVLGRNGVGKTSLLRALDRPAADQPRHDHHGKASDITAPAAARARPARHRLCAAGPRDLSAAHRRGKSRNRLRAAQARGPHRSGRRVFAVPGARDHAAAGAAATFPAASSSSSPSAARW